MHALCGIVFMGEGEFVRLWSWPQEVVGVVTVTVSCGCGHSCSKLWGWSQLQ